jgi:hypothetical protein
MEAVFREVRRVLRDDGTLWLNLLGDSYNGSGGAGGDYNAGGGNGGLYLAIFLLIATAACLLAIVLGLVKL